jgi:micrococcal nuclease
MTLKRSIILAILVAFIFPAILAAQDTFAAKVIGISDGDTITVLKEQSQIKIRLHGIDTPERGQAFGNKAKQFTSDLTFGKTVTVKPMDTDRYGRTVAWVFVNGKNLNEEIVKAGMGWHYEKYSSDVNLADAELEARKAKVGLWRDPNSIPPWEFRQLGHVPKSSSNAPNPGKAENAQIVYHGNIKSRVFHQPSCEHYNCKNCTVVFGSKVEAEAAGYRPCGKCRP